MTVALETWAWGLIGVGVFLTVGIAFSLALGLVGVPGDAVRRGRQGVALRRPVVHGVELPPEVPEEAPRSDEEAGARP